MFQNRLEGLALALPAILFTATLFLLPVLVLLSEGFRVDDAWSLQGYADFISKPLNQTIFFRTLKLGFLVAGVSAIIGYATAFSIFHLKAKHAEEFRIATLLPSRYND